MQTTAQKTFLFGGRESPLSSGNLQAWMETRNPVSPCRRQVCKGSGGDGIAQDTIKWGAGCFAAGEEMGRTVSDWTGTACWGAGLASQCSEDARV